MTDITNTHLEAALLDQNVAGAFPGKVYAFVAVIQNGYRLGVAVKDEAVYNPIHGKVFDSYAEAKHWANSLNEHIGLTVDGALDIVASTMGGPA